MITKAPIVRPDELLDAAGDDLQRVDIEPGVGFVEHSHPRLQHRHLQDLDTLLLAAGEAVVQIARGELARDLQALHLHEQLVQELLHRNRIVTSPAFALRSR